MNDLQTRLIECFMRINNFGAENAASVPPNSPAKTAFKTMWTGLAQLETLGVSRASAESAKFNRTALRGSLRQSLNEDLRAITQTARLLARSNPVYENKFRLPRADRTDVNLLETARAFAADATALKADFINYGLPADFLEDLAADADEFEQSMNEQDAANRQKVGATASIEDIFDRMIDAREILEVVVPNLFRGDAGKLADWATASRVERPARKKTEEPAA